MRHENANLLALADVAGGVVGLDLDEVRFGVAMRVRDDGVAVFEPPHQPPVGFSDHFRDPYLSQAHCAVGVGDHPRLGDDGARHGDGV